MKKILLAALFVASTGTVFAEGDTDATDARDSAVEAIKTTFLIHCNYYVKTS